MTEEKQYVESWMILELPKEELEDEAMDKGDIDIWTSFCEDTGDGNYNALYLEDFDLNVYKGAVSYPVSYTTPKEKVKEINSLVKKEFKDFIKNLKDKLEPYKEYL